MDHSAHNKIVSFIWSIADDCLRDVFVRGKYRDVILKQPVPHLKKQFCKVTKSFLHCLPAPIHHALALVPQGLQAFRETIQGFLLKQFFQLRDFG